MLYIGLFIGFCTDNVIIETAAGGPKGSLPAIYYLA